MPRPCSTASGPPSVLRGVPRERPRSTATSFVDLLLAVAGPGGFVLDDDFLELDCNPVIATPDGATSSTRASHASRRAAGWRCRIRRPVDFDALFAPRTIAVAGVSTNKPGFGNRALAAYRAFGWTDGLSVIHPTATEVDGVPAYPSVARRPGWRRLPPLPRCRRRACADLVRDAAGARARRARDQRRLRRGGCRRRARSRTSLFWARARCRHSCRRAELHRRVRAGGPPDLPARRADRRRARERRESERWARRRHREGGRRARASVREGGRRSATRST